MTQDELNSLLESTGFSVVYHYFTEPPTIPYIVYLFTFSENFGADNKVYAKINNYQVELYSDIKDPDSEQILEDIFDNNEIFYDKTEAYIKSEGLYQVLYEIQI